MRILLIPALAFWLAGSLYAYSIELSGEKVGPRLLPLVQRTEGSAFVAEFKVLQYEPNSGRARAYAVLRVVRPGRQYRVGRIYEFRSAPGSDAWTLAGRRTAWDQSRGQRVPWIAPYWALP